MALAVTLLALTGCSDNSGPHGSEIGKVTTQIYILKGQLASKKVELKHARDQEGTLRRVFHDTDRVNDLQHEVSALESQVKAAQTRIQQLRPAKSKHGVVYYFALGVIVILGLVATAAAFYVGVGVIAIVSLIGFVVGLGWVASVFL